MSSHLTLTTTGINKNCVLIGSMFIDEKQTQEVKQLALGHITRE